MLEDQIVVGEVVVGVLFDEAYQGKDVVGVFVFGKDDFLVSLRTFFLVAEGDFVLVGRACLLVSKDEGEINLVN